MTAAEDSNHTQQEKNINKRTQKKAKLYYRLYRREGEIKKLTGTSSRGDHSLTPDISTTALHSFTFHTPQSLGITRSFNVIALK